MINMKVQNAKMNDETASLIFLKYTGMLTKLLVLTERVPGKDNKVRVYAMQRNGHAGGACNKYLLCNMHKYFVATTI